MLDSGNGLTSFGEDTGFTASVESIFENLSPAILSAKDQMFSPWESADLSRVEFEEQGGLEGKLVVDSLSSSSEMQLRNCSIFTIPSRFIRYPSVKKKIRRVTVKRDINS